MRRASAFALLLPIALLVACDSSSSEPLQDGGGPRPDLGVVVDAGAADTGVRDTGPSDLGTPPDLGVTDLGVLADAGEPQDLGQPQDAGEPIDLGSPVDAGTTTATSCLAIKTADPAAPTGIYEIEVDGVVRSAFCDMELEGGGWTLALLKNSAHDGLYPDFGASPTNTTALATSPLAAATSTTPIAAWLNLNQETYTELRLASYGSSTRTFLSESIARSSLRIAFGEPGYLLYDDPNGYYWCGGPRSYTDSGTGQVNQPPGAPNGCKTHTSLGTGFDFGGQSYNTSMTMCGTDGYSGMLTGGPIGMGGSWVFYPNPGVAYAIWIR